MVDEQHLTILRQGTDTWNKWRKQHRFFTRPDFCGADLIGVNLVGANLRGADLSQAILNEANLFNADLHGADLYEAVLIRTDLHTANLREADMRGAILQEANLSQAVLEKAILIESDLRAADLSEAHLAGANLRGATLNKANLFKADLDGTDLSETSLDNTNLSQASIGWTILGNVDLRNVIGLETINHSGPSTIGTDTLVRSEGNIPEAFLRGSGLPDTFIDYVRSLVSRPIEYYSCFLSYSSQDDAFVKRLHADLQQQGVRCWFAPHSLRPGELILARIDEAIRLYDKLVLILSQHSVESRWVDLEVTAAKTKEVHQDCQMLFPLRLDETVMSTTTTWARSLREQRHIADFTGWKDHNTYQQAFTHLLRDLQASTEQKP